MFYTPKSERLSATRLSLGRRFFLLSLLFLALGSTAAADSPANQTAEPSDGALETEIETDASRVGDGQIRARITSIFAQIDSIASIEVSVAEGVVVLTGTIAAEEHAAQARALAGRVAGVVTVVDNLERSLDVEENIAPLIDGFFVDTQRAIKAIPLFLMALVIFLLIGFAGHVLAKQPGFWRRLTPNEFLAELVAQAFRVVAIGTGLVVALNILGAGALIGTILGGAGILTLAVGFAIRDTLENYISSIMLSLRQPFRANDFVVINEFEGIVVRLTSRATVLMTPEGNQLRIPNSTVFKSTILNYTRNPQRRFEFELGVDAADDPLDAMRVGLAAMDDLEAILHSPCPSAHIKTVGDSNIVLCFRGWVDQQVSDLMKTRSLAIRSAMRAVEDSGFTLPEPIYRIKVDSKTLSPSTLALTGSETEPATDEQDQGSTRGRRDQRESGLVSAGSEADDALDDVRPDNSVAQLAAEERREQKETDLLDSQSPQE